MLASARVNWLVARVAGLALLAALAAAGCSSGGASPTSAPTVTIGATTMPAAEATATPTVLAGPACTVEERSYTNAGPLGEWTKHEQFPVFSTCRGEAIINAVVDQTIARWLGVFVTRAKDVAQSEWPSTIMVTYMIRHTTPELLSVLMIFREDLGRARPSTSLVGLNFLVSDGTPIQLESLFTDATDGLIALSTRSRELLTAQLGPDADPTSIRMGTTSELANFEKAWAFTADGLEIRFQESQVGTYEMGTPVVVIPWSDLASVIAPSGPAGGFVR